MAFNTQFFESDLRSAINDRPSFLYCNADKVEGCTDDLTGNLTVMPIAELLGLRFTIFCVYKDFTTRPILEQEVKIQPFGYAGNPIFPMRIDAIDLRSDGVGIAIRLRADTDVWGQQPIE
jgi:hypothetical protein